APQHLHLSSLHAGEWVKLELHSEEVLQLFEAMAGWYRLFEQFGVPMGRQEFLQVSEGDPVATFIATMEGNPELLTSNDRELIPHFLKWLATADRSGLMTQLTGVPTTELVNFDVLLGVARLRQFLHLLETNMDNAAEEFWHQEFKSNSWV